MENAFDPHGNPGSASGVLRGMGAKIIIVLDRLRSAHNVGNIFRIAEAVGAAEIIGCGYTPMPPHPRLVKTAMGSDKMVPCRTFANSMEAVRRLREEGVEKIFTAEPGPASVNVWEQDYPAGPVAVVFGNEALGVEAETIALADGCIQLPMLGRKASINVGNAAAAILYAILARRNQEK